MLGTHYLGWFNVASLTHSPIACLYTAVAFPLCGRSPETLIQPINPPAVGPRWLRGKAAVFRILTCWWPSRGPGRLAHGAGHLEMARLNLTAVIINACFFIALDTLLKSHLGSLTLSHLVVLLITDGGRKMMDDAIS